METPFKFDTVESTPDIRDVFHSQTTTANFVNPEDHKDYSGIVHDNQRGIGICTAANVADHLQKIYGIEFSEQFIYVGGKTLIDGDLKEGSSIKTMLQFVYKYGAAPKSMVPTDDTRKSYADYVNVTFAPEVWKEALKYRIPGYAKVELDPISFAKAHCESQGGLETRMSVGDNFYTPSWNVADLEPLRVPSPVTGGHSIKVIGYKGLDGKQERTMRNSWGDSRNLVYPNAPVWGRDGDLDYVYATQQPYVTEAWTILKAPVSQVFIHLFNSKLQFGDNNSEVVALQRVLTRLGFFSGPITGYYGPLTQAAVTKFQEYYAQDILVPLGLSHGTGIFGPASIRKINSIQ